MTFIPRTNTQFQFYLIASDIEIPSKMLTKIKVNICNIWMVTVDLILSKAIPNQRQLNWQLYVNSSASLHCFFSLLLSLSFPFCFCLPFHHISLSLSHYLYRMRSLYLSLSENFYNHIWIELIWFSTGYTEKTPNGCEWQRQNDI